MKDIRRLSELSKEAAHGKAGSSNWDDDAKPQPLSNLFQSNIIMSPSHEEEEEGKTAPVVGVIIDFDEHLSGNVSMCGERVEARTKSNGAGNGKDGDETGSVDDSILQIAMFEGVLQESNDHATDEAITSDEIIPLPAVIEVPTKRPAEQEIARPQKKARSIRKPRNTPAPAPVRVHDTPEAKSSKPSPVVSALQGKTIAKDEPKKSLPGPRRRRPNCLFVNHFGTRLDGKGQAVRVNTPAKQPTPARISSEESVSIKTKVTSSTGRSSKSSGDVDSKRTPVKSRSTASLTAPPSVPTVVRIVTPNMKKPVRSSCLEDITMEEDILEPLKHDISLEDGEELLKGSHFPYLKSMPEGAPKAPPSPSPAAARMMHSMMPGAMSLNFTRPFPLLQRRAFLAGCHPMAAHPAAAFAAGPGWHPPFPGPGMPFPTNFAAAFGGHPTPAAPASLPKASSSSPAQSSKKSPSQPKKE